MLFLFLIEISVDQCATFWVSVVYLKVTFRSNTLVENAEHIVFVLKEINRLKVDLSNDFGKFYLLIMHGQRGAFFAIAPNLWNKLSLYIKKSNTLSIFKLLQRQIFSLQLQAQTQRCWLFKFECGLSKILYYKLGLYKTSFNMIHVIVKRIQWFATSQAVKYDFHSAQIASLWLI